MSTARPDGALALRDVRCYEAWERLRVANAALDRQLTSLDVATWKVRSPRTGLTVGDYVGWLTRLIALTIREIDVRSHAPHFIAEQANSGVAVFRPARMMSEWRKSLQRLQRAALHLLARDDDCLVSVGRALYRLADAADEAGQEIAAL